jgi:hypothetical protein
MQTSRTDSQHKPPCIDACTNTRCCAEKQTHRQPCRQASRQADTSRYKHTCRNNNKAFKQKKPRSKHYTHKHPYTQAVIHMDKHTSSNYIERSITAM